MPALETRAVVLALKWRARSVARMSKKFLHLADSQSALGSYARHRSSAYSLSYLIERGCALQLATGMEPIFAFVRTHQNPADKPSRMLLPLTSSARRDFRNLCSMEGCLQVATSLCDNCQQNMCREHSSAFDESYTEDLFLLCSLCCASPKVPGHQVTQRLGTPLQPGPLVMQRLGTPLLPNKDTSCEFNRCHRPAQWRCTGCNRWICHTHSIITHTAKSAELVAGTAASAAPMLTLLPCQASHCRGCQNSRRERQSEDEA
jgi:hypothetical protein